MNHWTLDDIPWDRFEAEKVDPHILRVAKAASVVELAEKEELIFTSQK